MKKNRIRRLTELSLVCAASLTVFVVEMYIPMPIPVPGVKLGLANVFTCFAAYRYRAGETSAVVTARVLLGALFAPDPTSLLYSAVGASLALAVMLPLSRGCKKVPLTSILGAAAHNTGQIAAAFLITRTPQIFYYLPILLLSVCVTGAFTGILAGILIKKLPGIRDE